MGDDLECCGWMQPKDIKYTQDSISYYFKRGPPIPGRPWGDESLKSLLEKLSAGKMDVDEIPRIRVVKYKGHWNTLDNQRLWVFRQLGCAIPVEILDHPTSEFFSKLSRGNGDGESIQITEPEKKGQSHEYRCKLGLMNRMLCWSMVDILAAFGDGPHVEEMVDIPLQFASLEEYQEVLSCWLLEESRTKFQQSLFKISDMPQAPVTIDSDIKPLGKRSVLKKLTVTIESKSLKRGRNKVKALYKPKSSDVVLLSTMLPEHVRELFCDEEYCILAFIQGEQFSSEDQQVLDAIVFAKNHGSVYKELKTGNKSWYAVKLDSLTTALRIWEGLHQPQATPLVQYILQYSKKQDIEQSICNSPEMQCLEDRIQKYCCGARGLNLSQTEAVRSSILGLMGRDSGPLVRLIQGPPGTGKTFTLSSLLSAICCLSTRILVCAPTNTAIYEVAKRFIVQKQSDERKGQSEFEISHFCRAHVAEVHVERCPCEPIGMGDIVMIGNEDRLVVEGALMKRIFLPLRLKRLLCAFSEATGWETSVKSFIKRLLQMSTSNHDEGALKHLGKKVIEHGETLCNDLPSRHINSNKRRILSAAVDTVKELLQLFPQQTLECKDAPEFSPGCNIGENGFGKLGSSGTELFSELTETFLQIMSSEPGYGMFPPSAASSLEWLEMECMENACLVFCTVSTAGQRSLKLGLVFNCVIIDEAAQLVEAETAIITQMKELKQIILVGDHKQLPATVISQLAQKHGYGRSLFERLQLLEHPIDLLNVQYRMHPAICHFPNIQFYNDELKNGPNVLRESHADAPFQYDLYGPYAFIDVNDGVEERAGSSKKNLVEAEIVVHLIGRIQLSVCAAFGDLHGLDNKPVSIGVISPYEGQVEIVKQCLKSRRTSESPGLGLDLIDVEVKSIDGFQGREKDIIIFSAVRANRAGNIGFLDNERRLNVALTRGRYSLWILGRALTLTAQSKVWRNLIQAAKKANCYVDASCDEKIRGVIWSSKREVELTCAPERVEKTTRGIGRGSSSEMSQLANGQQTREGVLGRSRALSLLKPVEVIEQLAAGTVWRQGPDISGWDQPSTSIGSSTEPNWREQAAAGPVWRQGPDISGWDQPSTSMGGSTGPNWKEVREQSVAVMVQPQRLRVSGWDKLSPIVSYREAEWGKLHGQQFSWRTGSQCRTPQREKLRRYPESLETERCQSAKGEEESENGGPQVSGVDWSTAVIASSMGPDWNQVVVLPQVSGADWSTAAIANSMGPENQRVVWPRHGW